MKRSSVEPWIENVWEFGFLEPTNKHNINDNLYILWSLSNILKKVPSPDYEQRYYLTFFHGYLLNQYKNT